MWEQKRGKPSTMIGQFLEDKGYMSDFRTYRATQPRGKKGKVLMRQFLEEEDLWDEFMDWITIEKL